MAMLLRMPLFVFWRLAPMLMLPVVVAEPLPAPAAVEADNEAMVCFCVIAELWRCPGKVLLPHHHPGLSHLGVLRPAVWHAGRHGRPEFQKCVGFGGFEVWSEF